MDRAVLDDVVRALRLQDILIVSEAGAGKTAALHEVAERLVRDRERVVILDATDRRLTDPRTCFGLGRPLEEVLARWSSVDELPGFLVIDGLDAMRASPAFDEMLRLISEVRGGMSRWRVLAATRDYDLESAVQLRALFPVVDPTSLPAASTDPRFKGVAHLALRGFTDGELASLCDRSESLRGALASASTDLRVLLRNPFNLSVVAQLAWAGDVDLSLIHDRVGLLDRWWEWRAIGISLSARVEKQSLLRALCADMLRLQELCCSEAALIDVAVVDALCSDGVLTKIGRYGESVAFAHAIIFDYAVFRLFLQTPSIAEFLEEDRSRSLFALPSIRMRLADLWERDRSRFHRELRELFVGEHRRTVLMGAARLVAERSRSLADVLPLFDYADAAARKALSYLVRILIHLHRAGLPVTGDGAGPWAALTLRIARDGPAFHHDGLLIIHDSLPMTGATSQERVEFAHAARLFMEQYLRDEEAPGQRAALVIQNFLKTYDVAPATARPQLERLLDIKRIERFGRYELSPVAYSLSALNDGNALLAIYEAYFGDVAVADGPVDVGNRSVVFSIVRDAKRSVSSARHALGERYASFLADHPREAVRALLAALRSDRLTGRRTRTVTVRVGSDKVRLRSDASNISDHPLRRHEPWYVMSSSLEANLRASLDGGDESLFRTLYEMLAVDEHRMYLWRIIIRNAGATKGTARMVAPFLANQDVLRALELGEPIADFFRMGYAHLEPEERLAIERELLGVLGSTPAKHMEGVRRRVALFVLEMPAAAIVTGELQEVRDTAVAERQQAADDDWEDPLSGWSEPIVSASIPQLSEFIKGGTESEDLARAIDAAVPLIRLRSPEDFTGESAWRAIEALERASNGRSSDARIGALDVICGLIYCGLERAVFEAPLDPHLTDLVLEGVGLLDTRDDEDIEVDEDEADNGTLTAGSPWRFSDGTLALGIILGQSCDARAVAALRSLLGAHHANVRDQAITAVSRVASAHPQLAAEFAERGAGDRSLGVMFTSLRLAWRLRVLEPSLATRLICAGFDRLFQKPMNEAGELVRWVISALLESAQLDQGALERVEGMIREPWRNARLSETLVGILGRQLESTFPIEQRTRAQEMLLSLVQGYAAQLELMLARYGGDLETYPAEDRNATTAYIGCLIEAAERLYYSSGTMVREYPSGFSDAGVIGTEQFEILKPLLLILASVKVPRIAYYVLKILLGAIRNQPAAALSLAAIAVRSGGAELARDHLAQDDVRAFALSYIRENRGLLSSDPTALSTLMDIVDAFVDAGWPEWIDVILELDLVYRE
jgi:hypothetical protein